MSFLCGETIIERLKNGLIIDENGNPAGNTTQVDCNAYELKVGNKAFITTGIKTKNNKLLTLSEGEDIDIHSGQFALLLTQEIVSIPNDLFGLISLKSSKKFHGLVNISGFHVDPGWKGRLIFTVFNAGPGTIKLICGEPTFQIWFAKLDNPTSKLYAKTPMRITLTSEDVNKFNGDTYTPQILSQRIDGLESLRHWAVPILLGTFALGFAINVASGFITTLMEKKLHHEENIKDDVLIDLKGALDLNTEKVNDIKSEIETLKKQVEGIKRKK